jgi:hypothetical protein
MAILLSGSTTFGDAAANRDGGNRMITEYRPYGCGDVVDWAQPPFNYPQEGLYARQLLFHAVAAVVLAAITVIVGLSLAGIRP